MDHLTLARELDGCVYGNEVTPQQAQIAKDNGLVIAYFYSDDCSVFSGAINDEGSHIAHFLNGKVLYSSCDEGEECPYFQELLKMATKLEVEWWEDIKCWAYPGAPMEHSVFDIFENEEKTELYGKGIVFKLDDLNKK